MTGENVAVGSGELFAALAKAQGEMAAARKDKTNPYFNSRYADLASVWDACREPLSRNGLCVVQLTEPSEGYAVVQTLLGHTSGQCIASRISVPMVKGGAQEYGKALTYARRYGLSALVGIAPDDDDDGNSWAVSVVSEDKAKANVMSWGMTTKGAEINRLLDQNAPEIRFKVIEDIEVREKPLEVVLGDVQKYVRDKAAEGMACLHPLPDLEPRPGGQVCRKCGEFLEEPACAAGAVHDDDPKAF